MKGHEKCPSFTHPCKSLSVAPSGLYTFGLLCNFRLYDCIYCSTCCHPKPETTMCYSSLGPKRMNCVG